MCSEAARNGAIDFSRIVAVSNRRLCTRPFSEQVERVCNHRPCALVLREKDLDEADYAHLAEAVLDRCRSAGVPCILHSHVHLALQLGADGVHLPLALLRDAHPDALRRLEHVGSSVHSVEEAREAQHLGANYVFAGHVFETSCKPGLEPRGLAFLRDVCAAVSIPVYAIGGIDLNAQRISQSLACGATGTCSMSAMMRL